MSPVLTILFLSLLLGTSVDTTEFLPSLHTRAPTTAAEAQLAQNTLHACAADDTSACNKVGVMGSTVINETSGCPFDAASNALQLLHRSTDSHMGLEQKRVLQFVPAQRIPALTIAVAAMAADFRARYPVLASSVRTDFADQSSLEASILSSGDSTPQVHAAVILQSASPNWSYTLRGVTDMGVSMSNTLLTSQELLSEKIVFDSVPFQVLLQRGSHLLQYGVDAFILEQESGMQVSRSLYLQPFPTPEFRTGSLKEGTAQNLALAFALALLIPVIKLVTSLVEEKEKRMKGLLTCWHPRCCWLLTSVRRVHHPSVCDAFCCVLSDVMLSMGLSPLALHASWFLLYVCLFSAMSLGFLVVTLGAIPHSAKFHIFMCDASHDTHCTAARRRTHSGQEYSATVWFVCVCV